MFFLDLATINKSITYMQNSFNLYFSSFYNAPSSSPYNSIEIIFSKIERKLDQFGIENE